MQDHTPPQPRAPPPLSSRPLARPISLILNTTSFAVMRTTARQVAWRGRPAPRAVPAAIIVAPAVLFAVCVAIVPAAPHAIVIPCVLVVAAPAVAAATPMAPALVVTLARPAPVVAIALLATTAPPVPVPLQRRLSPRAVPPVPVHITWSLSIPSARATGGGLACGREVRASVHLRAQLLSQRCAALCDAP